ncbi:MAG: DUF1214 domain-containing protein [Rhizobiaceae bacterium]
MIRTILVTAAALLFAIGGGAWLTDVSLRRFDRIGRIEFDGWTANPVNGTLSADPYSKARLARDASLSMGAAEGVTFYASKDEDGRPLTSQCTYLISGQNPSARLWTLLALSNSRTRFDRISDDLPSSLASERMVFGKKMAFEIQVSASARPGNWLAVPRKTDFTLALNLYDSPVATNKGLVETKLPSVKRISCDG